MTVSHAQPVTFSEELQRIDTEAGGYVVVEAAGRRLAARDRCPHRGAPLSAGKVRDGCLECPYHGWRFGADGAVADIPALGPDAALPPKARIELVDVDQLPLPTAARGERPPLLLVNDHPGLRKAWHPVCRSAELTAGSTLAVELLGVTHLIARGTDGALFGDSVIDHLGHVWLAPETPVTGLIRVEELGEAGWQHVEMPRVEGRYGLGLLLDNQLDPGHFSFVHRQTFGSGESAYIPPYELSRHEWGFETTFAVPISARNDQAALAGDRPLGQYRTMTYRYQAPAALWLRLDYHEMGGSTGILFCFTPLSAEQTRMDVDLYFRRPGGFTDHELSERLAFERRVLAEDLALQEKFESLALPLELTAEVHTRADKSAVEMRRILTRLLAL